MIQVENRWRSREREEYWGANRGRWVMRTCFLSERSIWQPSESCTEEESAEIGGSPRNMLKIWTRHWPQEWKRGGGCKGCLWDIIYEMWWVTGWVIVEKQSVWLVHMWHSELGDYIHDRIGKPGGWAGLGGRAERERTGAGAQQKVSQKKPWYREELSNNESSQTIKWIAVEK